MAKLIPFVHTSLDNSHFSVTYMFRTANFHFSHIQLQ